MDNFVLIIAITIAIVVFAILATVFAAMWVYKDAKARGLPAGLWAFLVVISSIFLGLILYILIARKQENVVCEHCKRPTVAGMFCSKCGVELPKENATNGKQTIKTRRGLLIASMGCIVLSFVFMIVLIFAIFIPSSGFMNTYSRSGFQHNILDGASARGVRQSSGGDTWEISFREAGAGFTFTNFYRARTQPQHLVFDINYTGYVHLMLSQGDTVINEILTEGFHEIDISAFATGRIRMEISNLYDGIDFSSVLTVFKE